MRFRLRFVAALIFCAAFSLAKGEEHTILLGARKVAFEISHGRGDGSKTFFLSLHSNEKTAVEAVKACLGEISGTLVAIQAGGDRRLHLAPGKTSVTIDPNRMFSMEGIERDLRRFSVPRPGDSEKVFQFGQKYFQTFIQGRELIVAIHNNTNGRYSIQSYKEGGSESGATGKLFINPDQDPDDFFVVTKESDFHQMKAAGYNVVLQSATPPDDGSLSVFCGKYGIRYINIETEASNLTKQIEMVRFVSKLRK